ncbi:MAG: hypothetical protein AB7O38_24910, partial [Pirellulaceae bacterium]
MKAALAILDCVPSIARIAVYRALVLAGLAIVGGSGCESKIPKVPILAPLQPGPKPGPVMLKKVVAKLHRGTQIGSIYGGLARVPQMPLVWRSGPVPYDPAELGEELRSEFESNGYEVVGDPDALFEDASEWRAEYYLGALIRDLKLDLWYPGGGYSSSARGKGDAYMEVEWQIY